MTINTKVRSLLKASAAAAILFAGSQSWGAVAYLDDLAGTSGTRTFKGDFGWTSSAGGAGTQTLTINKSGSKIYVIDGDGAASVTTTLSSTAKDCHVYFIGGAVGTPHILTAATAPTSGKANLHIMTPALSITPTLAATSWNLINDTANTGAAGATLTYSGTFAPNVINNGVMTTATLSGFSGTISGAGNLILGAATTFTGKMSNMTGNIVTGNNLMTTDYLPSQGTIESNAAGVTVTANIGPQSLGKLYSAVAGTFTSNVDVTIGELDLRTAAITFAPASGKIITVKKITPGSDNGITLNGNGSLKILNGSTSAGITITSGTLIPN